MNKTQKNKDILGCCLFLISLLCYATIPFQSLSDSSFKKVVAVLMIVSCVIVLGFAMKSGLSNMLGH